MFKALRKQTTTILVAMATAMVTAGGPAVFAAVQQGLNADKVDGKHAVGAGASKAARAGKLVATNAGGVLPNNIINKARNADKLDGINSTGFLRTNAKAANADKLDGKDSSEFLPSSGAVEVQAVGWRPQVLSPSFNFSETNATGPQVTAGAATSAIVQLRPDLPSTIMGQPLELVGMRVCLDFTSGSPTITDLNLYVSEGSAGGLANIASEIGDAPDTDGCTRLDLDTATRIGPNRHVSVYLGVANLGGLRLGSTTFFLRPAS